MFEFLILTIWFEINGELHMKHYPNDFSLNCDKSVQELVKKYEEKHPSRKIKAVKCNNAIDWVKKYQLNDWE